MNYPDLFKQPFIQIAGFRDIDEARMILRAGADFLGIPLRLDFHSPDVSEADAREIISELNAPMQIVLITYLDKSSDIVSLCNFLGVNIIQLHGPVNRHEIEKARMIIPQLSVIKSLIVNKTSDKLLGEVAEFSEVIDAFITDTYDPATGASGATGKTHDWAISREICRFSNKPVILAGGFTPENVEEAICFVKPAGVDVHTGVEDSTGKKDLHKVSQFIKNARDAFRGL